jgi:hypothetical protein
MRPADELSRLAVVGERLSRGGKQRVISVRLDEAIPGRAATRGPRSWPSMSEVTVLGAVAALEIGVAAAAALSAAARGTLTATFTRSLYVTIGGHWICIGPPGLGSGPLNALCALPDAPDWYASGIKPGTEVRIDADALHLGTRLVFSLTGARVWRPNEPPAWSVESLRKGLRALDRLAGSKTPKDGLGCFIRPHAAPSRPLARHAAPILRQFQRRLCERLASGDAPERDWPGSAVELLGLGPGLTPSGDDFLAGAMIALKALGRGDLSDRLWVGLEPMARIWTVDVSRAHLAAAARGMGSASLHDCLSAVLAGRDAALTRALSRIDAIGHCSGWDALAGAVAVLRGWSATAEGSGAALQAPAVAQCPAETAGRDARSCATWRKH